MIFSKSSRRDFLRQAAAVVGAPSFCGLFPGLPPHAAAPSISFKNVAASSGITFHENNSASPEKFQVETMTGGVALFDYNNDGLLDIFFANGARLPTFEKTDPSFFNRLYRNNGDGTFTDVTLAAGVQGSRYAMGVAVADYDNDGFQDFLVTGANGYQLFHNKGDGTFQDVTEKSGLLKTRHDLSSAFSVAAGWFDYDNDGHLDLIIVNYLKWSIANEVSCASSGVRAYCSPNSYEGLPNLLFHNNGDGTFTDVSDSSGIAKHIGKGMGVAFADYDQDGFVDVFVSNDTLRNFLFHNNGDGTFSEVGVLAGVAYSEHGESIAGMGADFRDIDNDGLPDIFVTAMHGDAFPLYRNAGKGFFDTRTSDSKIGAATARLTSWGIGIYDFDNDGWKDIFTANAAILDNSEAIDHLPYKMPNSIMGNNRDGTFTDVSAHAGDDFKAIAAHRGAAFGDINNDGAIDVVVNCLNAGPEVWINSSAPANHWLVIHLIGSKSNRDGLGARIKLVSAGGAQYNHATTSVGYGSSSDKRVHFGLGPDRRIDRLEIIWPSGIHQTLTDIAADQILVVHESANVPGVPPALPGRQ